MMLTDRNFNTTWYLVPCTFFGPAGGGKPSDVWTMKGTGIWCATQNARGDGKSRPSLTNSGNPTQCTGDNQTTLQPYTGKSAIIE